MKFDIKKALTKDNLTCVFRELTKEDAELYVKSHKKMLSETEYCTHYEDEMSDDLDMIGHYLEEKSFNIYCIKLGAFIDDSLVGCVSIDPFGYGCKIRHRAFFAIWVLAEYSNKGIGTLLSNFAIEFAKKFGYEIIELDVTSKNKNAIKLYEKLGFVQYGVYKKFFKLRDGRYFDNILMRLDLK